ncbi:abortive infection system toxin AbiGii family protein [Staphylococcus caprae]|uniref:abortive infection system toxin AbiGii family protein n=1 Tax=Staphylococcus caprae TaxID=29380 RepID=UPI001F593589|nr:abortive infection system toxin AbiGii family protein [Staphylococcus caprae]MCI2954773.1 abortive infection system toxin AbiGii family protein [Staphylococcus caprae]
MEIDFSKLKKKEYPKHLEDYYTRTKLNDEVLSKTNLKYTYDEEKDILELAKNREILFKFKQKINLPEDVEKKEDIDQFLFNSQTCISLDYDKSIAVIEGVEIPIKDMILNLSGESGQFEYKICPARFDEDDFIRWTLQYNDKIKEVKLTRVANNDSAFTKKYEYISRPLKITVHLTKLNDIHISVSTQFQGETTLESLLESLTIQIAFLEKKLGINGVPLSRLDSDTKVGNAEKLIRMNEILNFWSKVSLLQGKLNVKFYIDFPLDDETMQNLEKLIISFVLEEVYRENYKINNIKLNFDSIDELYNNIKKIKNDEKSSIHWREPQELCILGTKVNIYKYFGVFNYHIYSIIPDEETKSLNIYIKETNEDKMVIVSKFVLENEAIENVLKTAIPKYWVEYRDRMKSRE